MSLYWGHFYSIFFCTALFVLCVSKTTETLSGVTYEMDRVKVADSVNLRVGFVNRGGSPGSHPIFVLLHGFPEAWIAWEAVVPELLRHDPDSTLIVPDLRGFGRSDKPDEVSDYDLRILVSDVIALIDAEVGVDAAVHLVGHDWGGIIAFTAAGLHSDRFLTLSVLNVPHPAWFFPALLTNPRQQTHSAYMFGLEHPQVATFTTADSFVSYFRATDTWLTDDLEPLFRDVWDQPGAIAASAKYYVANVRIVAPEDKSWEGVTTVWEEMTVPRIKTPTLLGWGMKEFAFAMPEALSGSAAEICAGADFTLVRFEDAGHFVTHQQPAAVANAIFHHLQAHGYYAPVVVACDCAGDSKAARSAEPEL